MNLLTIIRAAVVAAITLGGAGLALASSYDAIAIDDEMGLKGGQAGYGVGEGDTAQDANGMALKNCRNSGNGKCQLVVTYQQCAAYASSRNHAGAGLGATEAEASGVAKERCGVDGCRVVISDCVGK